MVHRALRALGLALLLAPLAWPATMADAVTSAHTAPAASSRTAAPSAAGPSVRKRTTTSRAPAPSVRRRTGVARRGTSSSRAHSRRRAGPPAGGVYARCAILVDPRTGETLYAKNADRCVPIASLTKLMSALVLLEQKPDLRSAAAITAADRNGGGHTQLRIGERAAMGDLLHMSLMCSDNVATRTLARNSTLSHAEFVARMNRKAGELALAHTHFVEETGLDPANVSTAADVARLLHAAAHDPVIQDIVTTREYAFASETRDHVFRNTNRLLYGRREVMGGKTGYISEAGWCFATWVREGGRDLIAVVLGAPTEATRFADAVRLIQKASTATAAAPSAHGGALLTTSRAAAR